MLRAHLRQHATPGHDVDLRFHILKLRGAIVYQSLLMCLKRLKQAIEMMVNRFIGSDPTLEA